MLILLSALLAAAPHPADTVTLAAVRNRPSDPAVQISLNGGEYTPGERVNVQVQARDDGYLIAFRVDGDGRIRVLFPIDPDQDAFVRGGKRYELRGRADRETFLADDRSGNGMIYAAVSKEPMVFRGYSVNGHWDYNTLRLRDSSYDAEADLTEIVSRMTSNAHFDYDALGYRVKDIAYSTGNGYYPGFYDPSYNPAWRCFTCGWGYPRGGFNIGIGYSPFYDPFYYDPFYGYGYGYGYGFGSYYNPGLFIPTIYVGGGFRRPTLPNTVYGTRSRPRTPPRNIPAGSLGGSVPGIGTGIASVRPSGVDRGRPGSGVTGQAGRPGAGSNDRGRPASAPAGRPSGTMTPVPTPGAPSGVRARPRPQDEAVVRRPPTTQSAPPPTAAVDRRPPEIQRMGGVVGTMRPTFREPPRPQPQGQASGQAGQPPQARPEQQPAREARPIYREPPRPQPEYRPQPQPESRPQAPPPQTHSSPPPASHGGSSAPVRPTAGGGGGSSRGGGRH